MPLLGILKGANLVVVFLGYASGTQSEATDSPMNWLQLIFVETGWKISISKYQKAILSRFFSTFKKSIHIMHRPKLTKHG